MRKKLLVGNWKMNKTPKEAYSFALNLNNVLEHTQLNNLDIGIAPTYLCLDVVRKNTTRNVLVFAQNVHFETQGAFTGEISSEMLKSIDVEGSIIGHSERRMYNNETSFSCNKKIKSLLKNGLIPLYCVGESESEFNANQTKNVIKKQINEGLKDLDEKEITQVIIAYEPIWSIGTGKNASSEIAESVCAFIRKEIAKLAPMAKDKIRILYGGSVKPNNIKEYLSLEDVDGALVGGASLKIESFTEMINALI